MSMSWDDVADHLHNGNRPTRLPTGRTPRPTQRLLPDNIAADVEDYDAVQDGIRHRYNYDSANCDRFNITARGTYNWIGECMWWEDKDGLTRCTAGKDGTPYTYESRGGFRSVSRMRYIMETHLLTVHLHILTGTRHTNTPLPDDPPF
jgi:hypothetical protein